MDCMYLYMYVHAICILKSINNSRKSDIFIVMNIRFLIGFGLFRSDLGQLKKVSETKL